MSINCINYAYETQNTVRRFWQHFIADVIDDCSGQREHTLHYRRWSKRRDSYLAFSDRALVRQNIRLCACTASQWPVDDHVSTVGVDWCHPAPIDTFACVAAVAERMKGNGGATVATVDDNRPEARLDPAGCPLIMGHHCWRHGYMGQCRLAV